MTCRGCRSDDLHLVVDLGRVPDADLFPLTTDPLPDPVRPLQLWRCPRCTLVQLDGAEVTPEQPVFAVESDTSRRHAGEGVSALLEAWPHLRGEAVVEFASHHGGSWLPALEAAGCPTAGEGPAALVIDVHGLAHEPNLDQAIAERVDRLAGDGVLLLEFHHLLPLIRNRQFDTIRHGHWNYLSAHAVRRLVAPYGLELIAATATEAFGGSLQLAMSRHGRQPIYPSARAVLDSEVAAGITTTVGLHRFAEQVSADAKRLRAAVAGLVASGVTVAGYGAPSKACVLLNVSGIGQDLLPFTVDRAAGKHGRRIPGVGVPIYPVERLHVEQPDAVLILTWDIAAEVIADLESAGGWGARYLLPLELASPAGH